MSQMKPRYDTKLFTEVYDDVTKFVTDYQNVGIPTTISNASATTLYYLIYARYGNNPLANYDITQFKYKLFSIIFQYGPTWEKRLSVQQTLRGLQLSDLIDDGGLTELFTHEGEDETTESGTNGNTRNITESGTNTGTQTMAHTGTVGNSGSSTSSTDHDNSVTNSGNFEDIKNHAMNPSTAPATNAYSALGYINDQVANKNTSSGTQTVDESTATTGSTSDTTTYNNTDTRTDNLANSSTGTVTDSGTTSGTKSGSNSATNNLSRNLTQGKLKAYEKLLELLDADVTGDFIAKFRICFKQFVLPERTWIYVTEDEEEEEE